MAMCAQFNCRENGDAGGTNFDTMSANQGALYDHLCRRPAETLACMILNHTTVEEQDEMLRVYRDVIAKRKKGK